MTQTAVKDDIIKAIEGMTVLELAELVDTLKDKFGVTAMMPASVSAVPAGGAAAPAVEEKTSFDVILTSISPDKKIQAIKIVRELTNLGLKDAKDLVEAVPKQVKSGVSKEESETMKKKLEDVGAKVEVK